MPLGANNWVEKSDGEFSTDWRRHGSKSKDLDLTVVILKQLVQENWQPPFYVLILLRKLTTTICVLILRNP